VPALLATIAALTPSAAQAKIVVGQSIAGVKLGSSEAQVRHLLGKPTSCEPCKAPEIVWRYEKGFAGDINFDNHGRVTSMWTGSTQQRTAKGIHANGLTGHGHGSSVADIKRAYPGIACEEMPNSNGFTSCDLFTYYHGRKVDTNFLVKAAFAGVAEISVGFAQ
jgi:hypothetical protein